MKAAAAPVLLAIMLIGAGAGLSACSSQDAAQDPASSEPPAAVNPDIAPAMLELCDQMVAEAMTVDDATSLAESNGYIARVGSVDGEPQAVTMDYRIDRFTFEVVDGVVTSCQYG